MKTLITTLMSMKSKKGFAMLFTVLIISIILAIALSISDISYKQNLLSSIAKDSEVAYYQADSGTECALYYDFTVNQFPRGQDISNAPATIMCGNETLTLDQNSYTDHVIYSDQSGVTGVPCVSIVFDKTDPVVSKVQSRGYSVCDSTPKQVERSLEVDY